LFCIYTYHSSDSDAPFFIYYFIFLSTLTRSRPPTRHCFPTVWKKKAPSNFFKGNKNEIKMQPTNRRFCLVSFCFDLSTKMNKIKKAVH
jgi:hypothetical protein